jgi:two-component system sensor histidine kinase RegB
VAEKNMSAPPDTVTPATTTRAGDFGGGRSLRLDTLIRLRWLAVVGQAIAVVFVAYGLRFPMPEELCFALIGLSALVNLGLRIAFSPTLRLGQWPALLLLGYDVAQLGGLLFLTGGLDNPFAILLLVPVIVSATTLDPRSTIILGILVIGTASLLALEHLPLPWLDETLSIPLVYTAGIWLALVSACVFTGIYTFRVAEEARQLAQALSATEMVLAREHHLSALDGLAAAAAHELGTPLATIAVVAKEMARELPKDSPLAEDLALVISQSQRCRDILGRLTTLSWQGDEHLARVPLSHLIEEVVEPYRAFTVKIEVVKPDGEPPEPVGRRNPAIVQALANLVENAVDFARYHVAVGSEWTETTVSVTITDDGPGFSGQIMERIGDPYVTTRGTRAEGADPEAGGLGLGFFIAKTLLERSGAKLSLANREPPARGAIVRVSWPRALMDIAAPAAAVAEQENINSGMAWRKPVESL